MSSTSMKPIVEKNDVREVFNELLEDNGITTSVDVKNELRNRGFWATQERVAGFMREISAEDGIDFDFNGIYREYLLNSKPVIPNNPYSYLGTQSAQGFTKPAIDPADREPIDNPEDGDWEAFDSSVPSAVYYFKGKLSAGQAKSAFCEKLGTDFLSARVKRYQS